MIGLLDLEWTAITVSLAAKKNEKAKEAQYLFHSADPNSEYFCAFYRIDGPEDCVDFPNSLREEQVKKIVDSDEVFSLNESDEKLLEVIPDITTGP